MAGRWRAKGGVINEGHGAGSCVVSVEIPAVCVGPLFVEIILCASAGSESEEGILHPSVFQQRFSGLYSDKEVPLGARASPSPLVAGFARCVTVE